MTKYVFFSLFSFWTFFCYFFSYNYSHTRVVQDFFFCANRTGSFGVVSLCIFSCLNLLFFSMVSHFFLMNDVVFSALTHSVNSYNSMLLLSSPSFLLFPFLSDFSFLSFLIYFPLVPCLPHMSLHVPIEHTCLLAAVLVHVVILL